MDAAERPIGYWLKRLHDLIEGTFDDTLAGEGLTRRHWQTLNAMRTGGPLSRAALGDAMAPFWEAGAVTLDEVVEDLRGRGWVATDAAGRYALTPAGEAAHAAIAARVGALRERILNGMTIDDYRATVRNLRRMADNLTPSGAG